MADQDDDLNLADYAVPLATAPPASMPSPKPTKHPVGKFLKGPVQLSWLIAAGKLPGKALVVGMGLWYMAGLTGSKSVKATGALWKTLSISRQAAYRAVTVLESHGLIKVQRQPGRASVVTICRMLNDCSEGQSNDGQKETD